MLAIATLFMNASVHPILGKTQLLGVIGDPIEHSLSPVMHNAALNAIAQSQGLSHMPFVYVPLRIKREDFASGIEGLQAIHWQGFNITIPHKQAIIPLLNQITPIAESIGAVNTVWWTEAGWAGTNTDVQGFLAPLLTQERDWSKQTAIILGNGGASRAVIAGCQQLNLKHIRVVGRDRSKLEQLQHSFAQAPAPCTIEIHLWAELPALLKQAHLVVNTTPLGMAPNLEQSPLSQADLAKLPAQAIVYDLIYTPRPTRLLSWAMDVGLTAMDGLEMLVQQGAAALEIWTQTPPPIDVMRTAAEQILGH